MLIRRGDRKPFDPDREKPLGEGGEGVIYRYPYDKSLVVKIYKSPTAERAEKLEAMLANPPSDPTAKTGHHSIAWPQDVFVDKSRVVRGFLMPAASGEGLDVLYHPASRRRLGFIVNHKWLMAVARNVAWAMDAVHQRGYVVGDVKAENVRASDKGLVTLLDTDSFQVRQGAKVFRCSVGTGDYTPPELQSKTLCDIDRLPEHDHFGLAVLAFRLTMEGQHPFNGRGRNDIAPHLEARISEGLFPYGGSDDRIKPPAFAPELEQLPHPLPRLFIRAFRDGYANPAARPSAAEWRQGLDAAIGLLKICPSDPSHSYSEYLSQCPWCARRDAIDRAAAGSQRRVSGAVFPGGQVAPILPLSTPRPSPVVAPLALRAPQLAASPQAKRFWATTPILIGVLAALLVLVTSVTVGLLRSVPGITEKIATTSTPEQPVRAFTGEWMDTLANASIGRAKGLRFVPGPLGTVAEFRSAGHSQIEYAERFPAEGTLELWIYVESGYGYQDSKLTIHQNTAVVFSSDNAGADVAWPGAATLRTGRDGTLVFTMSTAKYGHAPNQTIRAAETAFRFDQWHSLGVSWGSSGQCLFLDGRSVADEPTNTQRLGAGGTHERQADVPTIGETSSRFWKPWRYAQGFEGKVARVRVSPTQRDWKISTTRPFQEPAQRSIDPTPGLTIGKSLPSQIQAPEDASSAAPPETHETAFSAEPSPDQVARQDSGAVSARGEKRLSCEPAKLQLGAKLTLVLPRMNGWKVTVHTPAERTLVITSGIESRSPSQASDSPETTRLTVDTTAAVGVEAPSGRPRQPEFTELVFTEAGTYDVIVMETGDSGDALASGFRCSVYLFGETLPPTPTRAMIRRPTDWKN
ncbi:MAG TPA: hypothetical protein VGM13_04550 [Thermoanaerobaculia bacterium]|jgi:serine/threonine protein kinase